MARFVIERDFGLIGDDEMQEVAVRSKAIGLEHFPDITWEHSHVVADDAGRVRSFCVYEAPNKGRLREHAERMGSHTVANLYEIVGDVDPREIKL